jgi:hypothetical protein
VSDTPIFRYLCALCSGGGCHSCILIFSPIIYGIEIFNPSIIQAGLCNSNFYDRLCLKRVRPCI